MKIYKAKTSFICFLFLSFFVFFVFSFWQFKQLENLKIKNYKKTLDRYTFLINKRIQMFYSLADKIQFTILEDNKIDEKDLYYLTFLNHKMKLASEYFLIKKNSNGFLFYDFDILNKKIHPFLLTTQEENNLFNSLSENFIFLIDDLKLGKRFQLSDKFLNAMVTYQQSTLEDGTQLIFMAVFSFNDFKRYFPQLAKRKVNFTVLQKEHTLPFYKSSKKYKSYYIFEENFYLQQKFIFLIPKTYLLFEMKKIFPYGILFLVFLIFLMFLYLDNIFYIKNIFLKILNTQNLSNKTNEIQQYSEDIYSSFLIIQTMKEELAKIDKILQKIIQNKLKYCVFVPQKNIFISYYFSIFLTEITNKWINTEEELLLRKRQILLLKKYLNEAENTQEFYSKQKELLEKHFVNLKKLPQNLVTLENNEDILRFQKFFGSVEKSFESFFTIFDISYQNYKKMQEKSLELFDNLFQFQLVSLNVNFSYKDAKEEDVYVDTDIEKFIKENKDYIQQIYNEIKDIDNLFLEINEVKENLKTNASLYQIFSLQKKDFEKATKQVIETRNDILSYLDQDLYEIIDKLRNYATLLDDQKVSNFHLYLDKYLKDIDQFLRKYE